MEMSKAQRMAQNPNNCKHFFTGGTPEWFKKVGLDRSVSDA
jgi:hypothetical protein